MKNHHTAILCPNCNKLVSADETRCPYCDTTNPGSWWKNNVLVRGFGNPEQLIKVIISVNIGMYIVSLLIYPSKIWLSPHPFLFLSPGLKSLLLLGATGTIPIGEGHRWWSLVSASYLHGGIVHILFNMIAFKQLSPMIIQEYGTNRMLIIYTVSGVIGFLISYLAGVTLTMGASAAICGLLGAALYYGKSRGGAYGQAIYKQIGGWIIGLFIFGLVVPNINNWGHGGGILAGLLLGFLLGYHERNRENLFHKILAGGCVAGTLLILCRAVISGIYIRFLA